MIGLTARQRQLLDFIDGYIIVMGYPPTFRDMRDHMKIRSTNGINDHLRCLERKGYIVRTDNRARAIRIVQREQQPATTP